MSNQNFVTTISKNMEMFKINIKIFGLQCRPDKTRSDTCKETMFSTIVVVLLGARIARKADTYRVIQ